MHGENRDAAVDDVHAVFCQHVCDSSAATSVNAAKLSGLELDASVVHNATNQCNVLGIGIVRANLAAATSELVKSKTVTHDGGVLDFKATSKAWVITSRNVAREHVGVSHAAAQKKWRLKTGKRQNLCHDVLKEEGVHASSANGANLFLVGQDGDGSTCRSVALKLRNQGRVGAAAVVVTVAQDHGAIKAHVTSRTCRNNLKLSGEKVCFLNAVEVLQDVDDVSLNSFLWLVALSIGGFLAVLTPNKWTITNNKVEHLTLDDLGSGLSKLLSAQVDEKVGNAENRIGWVLTNAYVYDATVFKCKNAVNCQGNGDPLVLLDAAVVVGVKGGQLVALLKRVLLDVQARGVDVSSKDV